MTAEVAIFNNQAIALAADSAVTIGRDRVWKHANKLFSAGPRNDIGVMIYNTGDFLGVPWEVIVKEHRRSVSGETFRKLEEFADSFISFIQNKISNAAQEVLSIDLIIIDILENLEKSIVCDSRVAFYSELPKLIASELQDLDVAEDLNCSLDLAKFERAFRKSIKDLSADILPYLPKRDMLKQIAALIFKHIAKKSESEFATGLVIAGYGRDELFPVVVNFIVDGKWNGFLRCWKTHRGSDLNSKPHQGGGIIPFAQSDMAYHFIEGIYPNFNAYLEEAIEGLLDDKSDDLIKNYVQHQNQVVEKEIQSKQNKMIALEISKEFQRYRVKEFVIPLMKTVAALPKEEMAAMAKAMVELTALRRKLTSNLESVGGAIDVALISKSDGFIWIDRKHYFEIDKNSDFLDRKRVTRGG